MKSIIGIIFFILTIVFSISCSQYVSGRIYHPLGFLSDIEYEGKIYTLFTPTSYIGNDISYFFKENVKIANTIALLDIDTHQWKTIAKISDINISCYAKTKIR